MKPLEDTQVMLERAAALEAEQPLLAGNIYAEVLSHDPSSLDAHNALEMLSHPERYSHWMRINCRIHPADDIFRFISGSPTSKNPIRDYLADGWRTLSELMVLLETLDQPLIKTKRLLEFASGYGRLTRHIAQILPGKVTCADVLPGSVEFLREQFGVDGFYSSMQPEDLRFPEQFDLVFVLSLFTHLPVHAWRKWLRALASAVKPGGLLLLSVHNEAAAGEFGVQFDERGIFFKADSESHVLIGTDYGTTLTTREVVENEIAQALSDPIILYRERAFWVGQDAIVIRIGQPTDGNR